MADDRTLAQFFFELGYGACWAEAAIRNGEKPPFDLTDAVIERAWAITPETYDDHAEFDDKLGLVDAAPDMLFVLELIAKRNGAWSGLARQAAAKARGEAL